MSGLKDWRLSRRRRDTREVVRVESNEVEKLPQQYIDELNAIKGALERFKNSQEFVLPKAFQELVERVARLERQPIDVTPAEPAELQDEIKQAMAVAGEVGDAALRNIEAQQSEIAALKGTVMHLDFRFSEFLDSIERDIARKQARGR